MKIKNTPAFTLVELIVITILLAILTTMGYISLRWYAQDARNSNRLSDMKSLEKSMKVYIVRENLFPIPDDVTNITYWWEIVSYQWVFGTWVLGQIWHITSIPEDPLAWVQYSYWLANDRLRYEIGSAIEWWWLAMNSLINQSYALSSSNLSSHTSGTYNSYDIGVASGTGCSLITIPSLLLSDIPAWWVITNGGTYRYSYTRSPHIPANYNGAVTASTPQTGFQISEILSSCTIWDISDLELYIALLSTSYQQLSSIDRFKPIVFESNDRWLQEQVLVHLQTNNISIDSSVIELFQSPVIYRVFTDTFTDTESTLLIGGHIPAPLESWSLVAGWNASAYVIESNTLTKNGVSSSLVYPNPEPAIAAADYDLRFDVNDFSGGDISVYLRYTDSNNYYRLDISSAGYQISKRESWSDTVFQSISDPISPWSTIVFSAQWDSLTLTIDDVEKENIVAGGINAIWNPAIYLHNNNASIDNYTLTYQ